ncbi:MAG: hypothetical protein WC568_06385 [Candidatus Methanoperedens sp.]
MSISEFFPIFLEIYTAGAAFVLIFLIGQILYMMHKVDKTLLKAKLFLNDDVMQRTWMYISIAGASFGVNTLVKFAVSLTQWGKAMENFYMFELTQILFLISFIMAVYNWYVFIGSFVKSHKEYS